jgi:hypothetical protein
MQDDAEKIVNAVLTAACNGDMTAAKIILDRAITQFLTDTLSHDSVSL